MNPRQVSQRTANVETATATAEEIDRLSSLPDSLLIDILDCVACTDILPFKDYIPRRLACIKEAARTAVLSKQWRFLWTNLPFEFHDKTTDPEEIDKFVARVHAMLAVRSGPALRALEFDFIYYDRLAPDLDSWLDFAAKNKVQTLNLFLKRDYKDRLRQRYTLPEFIYSNSSLTELHLSTCVVKPRGAAVDWPCLKKLSLRYINLRKKTIDLILSGCPGLETLELYECRGIERLHIGGRSPRRLIVCCNDECRLNQISAPYLRELELELSCYWLKEKRNTMRIQNVPYLQNATIGICLYSSIPHKVMRKIINLFQDICHVKTLHLSLDSIKAISVMVSNRWELPRLIVEDLKIDVFAKDVRTIYGVVAILESCPYLEKLAFDNSVLSNMRKGSFKWGQITRDDINCDLLRLRIVEFSNYVSSDFSGELVSTLARNLLQRASVLEEIVIINDVTPCMSTEEIDAIKEELLNYPKSSTKLASVIVRNLD